MADASALRDEAYERASRPESSTEAVGTPEPEISPSIPADGDDDPVPVDMLCRICYEGDRPDDKLFSPCLCSGTCKYIHVSCLNKWRHQVKILALVFQLCAIQNSQAA